MNHDLLPAVGVQTPGKNPGVSPEGVASRPLYPGRFTTNGNGRALAAVLEVA